MSNNASKQTNTNIDKQDNHVPSPLTPHTPNKQTMEFAAGLLRDFGQFALVDTKGGQIGFSDNPEIFRLIKTVLTSLASGKAVSVVPYDAELTTHQAAHFLNVSRPHLVKLLEEGKIPYHKVGTHRRVKFDDVLQHKSEQQKVTRASLKELTNLSEEYGLN